MLLSSNKVMISTTIDARYNLVEDSNMCATIELLRINSINAVLIELMTSLIELKILSIQYMRAIIPTERVREQ